MLEVVFSDSAAGTMAVAIGHKGFLGGATSVIISDGTVSKEEIEKFQHQAEERERSGWENAIPLEGNRKDIVNLPRWHCLWATSPKQEFVWSVSRHYLCY